MGGLLKENWFPQEDGGHKKKLTQFIILPRGNLTKMSKIYIEY